jgi:hypothetical protein
VFIDPESATDELVSAEMGADRPLIGVAAVPSFEEDLFSALAQYQWFATYRQVSEAWVVLIPAMAQCDRSQAAKYDDIEIYNNSATKLQVAILREGRYSRLTHGFRFVAAEEIFDCTKPHTYTHIVGLVRLYSYAYVRVCACVSMPALVFESCALRDGYFLLT